jgi:hypothetical protein
LFAYLGYALLLLVVAGASYWVGIRNTANNLVNEVAKYDTTQDKIPGSADLPQIPAAQNKNTIKATSSSGEKPPTQLDIADEPNTINGKPSDPSLKSADEPNPETDNSKNAPESDAAKNNPETKTKPENIETIKKPDRTNSSQPGTPEKQSETPRPHKLSLCATPITLYDKESESGLFSQANTIDTKKLNINAGDLAGVTIQMTDRSAVIFEKNDGNKSVSWNLVVIDGEQRTRIATLGAESESGENEISMRFEDSKISPEIIKKLDGQLFIIRSDISDRQFAYVFCRSAESLFKSSLRLKWPDLSLVETIEKESDNDLSLFIPCELMPNKFKGQPVRKSDSGRLAWDIYHPDTENLEASEEKLRIHFDLQTPTNDKTELKVEFRPRHDKDKDAATKFQNELVRYGNYDANYKSKLNAKKNGFNARQAFINLITDQAAKADQQKRLDEEIQNAKNEFNRNIEKLKPVIQRKESREAIDALFREIMPSQSKLENHGLYLSCCVYKHVRLQIEGNSILFCIPVAVFGDDKEMVLKLLNAHLCQ